WANRRTAIRFSTTAATSSRKELPMSQGRRVADTQVQHLRNVLHQGESLSFAAMKAGMTRKTARKYRDRKQLPSAAAAPHTWRTRPDPLASVWPQLEELLLREPKLQAKTL